MNLKNKRPEKKGTGRKTAALLAAMLLLSAGLAGCGGETSSAKLSADDPVTVTIWHYYNSEQLEAFNKLVAEFNDTIGKTKGIIVEGFSQGNVTDLEKTVLDSVNKKVGAGELPSVFAAYADTAYAVDQLGYAVDLTPYLTEEEKDAFIGSYLEEGRFSEDGGLKIFPVAKSTEVFILNKTDWDPFAAATGVKLADLETFEGVTATAKSYYEWTDGKTEAPNDGKAFFGRDAMANYFIIGAKQLGVELFAREDGKTALHFDREVVKKLWDNYYVPYIRGYFKAQSGFRSDDIRTGDIIALVGSSSGATFFPKEVIGEDEEAYPIEMLVLPCPGFAGGERYAVQQGAGMVVTKTNEKEILASVEFLKWFTQDAQNIRYSISSGYLPVTKTANDLDAIKAQMSESDTTINSVISTAVNTVRSNALYTTKAFENGTQARSILEYSLFDKAKEDRAAIEKDLDAGTDLAAAVAAYESEENFEAWYEETKRELEALVQ